MLLPESVKISANCSYALLPPKKSWCQTISNSTMEEGEEVRLEDGVEEVPLVLFNHTVSVSMYEQNRGHVCHQEHSYLNNPDGDSHCMLRSCSTHATWWHVLVVIAWGVSLFHTGGCVLWLSVCRNEGFRFVVFLYFLSLYVRTSQHRIVRMEITKIYIYFGGLEPALVFTSLDSLENY